MLVDERVEAEIEEVLANGHIAEVKIENGRVVVVEIRRELKTKKV